MARNIFWCTARFNGSRFKPQGTGSTSFQYLHQFESIYIASYADDTTPYVCYEDIDLISGKLEIEANKILEMFKENGITANAGNCHNLLTVKKEKIFSLEDTKCKIVKLKICLES